jgi:DNA-binding beta-propeller fold protein YncE
MRFTRSTTFAGLAVAAVLPLGVAAAHAVSPVDAGRPGHYEVSGDPVSEGGSKFEGIGVDRATASFYVSEVTGGEIHRGSTDRAATEEWLAGDGTDGRFTARGITVDDEGRVYVAGGPNGTGNARPDLWVYDRDGSLLAALRVPDNGAFLNDVAIGPDGAAYVTDSNEPTIFRVAEGPDGWEAAEWADGSELVTPEQGFNLGGIVLTPDRSAFVVAQGTTGQLWRFDTRTGRVSEVDTGGADLTNADGLVRSGRDLVVVRNFDRELVHLEIDPAGTAAAVAGRQATDPDRVLTTGKLLAGRLLLVDSHFDEATGAPPYQVVTQRMPR